MRQEGKTILEQETRGGMRKNQHSSKAGALNTTLVKKNKKGHNLKDLVLQKCPTGIRGVDEITYGGLPQGRPTLICGSAGSGKTLFAMEFIVHGALEYNEPGVFVSFEENSEELTKNFASLGIDLQDAVQKKMLVLDHVYIEPSEIEETGEYDLDGLFVRLGYSIDSIGAKRVALDTLEALFSGLGNENILRAELRRLFRWLKTKGVTAVITAERGDESLTRFGLEEYVADCVILLDHRVNEQIATRRLKIIKYRGSRHETNEYPFLISQQGISVLPITSLGLDYPVISERISTGIKTLDAMFDNKGYYQGSAVMISGTAGTGKSIMAAHFVNHACSKGKHCLYFAFEEPAGQIIRNMGTIGVDLEQWVEKGLLNFSANRPSFQGLEMHLVSMHDSINEFEPDVVVIDPISNLVQTGTMFDTKAMLTRLMDYLKMQHITVLMTNLTLNKETNDNSEIGISSLTDTIIRLDNVEEDLRQNRFLTIVKSRGMNHSNLVNNFVITNKGIQLKTRGGKP